MHATSDSEKRNAEPDGISRRAFLRGAAIIAACAALPACASQNDAYREATSPRTGLKGNGALIYTPYPRVVAATQEVLTSQAFIIDSVSATQGSTSPITEIKATRIMSDAKNPEVSYRISLVTTIIPTAEGKSSRVVIAANQQTSLHRKWHDWWHLLWIVPVIPTGTEYQTVVSSEGDIKDPKFYANLIESIRKACEGSTSALKERSIPASQALRTQ